MSNTPSLSTVMKLGNDAIFFNEKFRTVLEHHIPLLRNSEDVTIQPVNKELAYKWEGDFYGLLSNTGIELPREFFWITMRLNGLKNSQEYDGRTLSIMLPSIPLLRQIAIRHKTSNNASL